MNPIIKFFVNWKFARDYNGTKAEKELLEDLVIPNLMRELEKKKNGTSHYFRSEEYISNMIYLKEQRLEYLRNHLYSLQQRLAR